MKESYFRKQFMEAWSSRVRAMWYHVVTDPRFATKEWHGDKRAVDVLIGYPPNGQLIGAEFKMLNDAWALPLKRIRQSQIDTLERIELCGGRGLFIVGMYRKRSRSKFAVVLPVKVLKDAIEYRKKIDGHLARSVDMQQFCEDGAYQVRYTDQKWDIEKLDRIINGKI